MVSWCPTMYSKNTNLSYTPSWYPNYPGSSHPQFLTDSESLHHQHMYYPPLFQSSSEWTHENFPGPQNSVPPTAPSVGLHQINQHHVHNEHITEGIQNIPSPPVSGSEMSSPGINNESASPQAALRPTSNKSQSPFEWMKKPSYQNQPNTVICDDSLNSPLQLDSPSLTYSQVDGIGKTRTKDKYRVVYTDYQRLELEKEYHTSKYITIRRKSELAVSLQLSERQVKIWFQNRRAKDRKTVKKNGGETPAMHPASIAHNSHMDIKPKIEGGLLQYQFGMSMGMNTGMNLHHIAQHFNTSSLSQPPPHHAMNQVQQVQ